MTLKFSPASHRYWLDGKPIPGVTTLIGDGLPKKALIYWAAKSVAEYVADNAEHLRECYDWMDRGQLVAMLKETPWSARDRAAVKGTDVHALAEKLVAGEEVEVPDLLAGFVDSCVRFLDDWKVHPVITEVSAAHRSHWWAGRPDLVGRLPDGRVGLFDWKTGASGIWPETAFQLAAYSHAEFYTTDGEDENPFPQVDFCAAVWLREDGYDVIPVKADDAVYQEFRHIAYVAKTSKRMKDYVGDPLVAPSQEEVVA